MQLEPVLKAVPVLAGAVAAVIAAWRSRPKGPAATAAKRIEEQLGSVRAEVGVVGDHVRRIDASVGEALAWQGRHDAEHRRSLR